MAFENVNPGSLRNAINSCRNSINKSKIDNIKASLSSDSVWQADAKKNFLNALTKLKDERYKQLEEQLNKYIQIPPLIEEYQRLEKENKTLEQNISNLQNTNNSLQGRLWRTVNDESGYEDEYGNRHTRIVGSHQEKDYGVENQINANNNQINNHRHQINNNKQRMLSIIAKVNSII